MDSQFHTPSPHAPCSMGGQKNGKTVKKTLPRFLQLLPPSTRLKKPLKISKDAKFERDLLNL